MIKPEELTAWTLDELSVDDAARVEAALEAAPEIASRAVDTRVFCSLLTEHLGRGEDTLTSEQRRALLAHVSRHTAGVWRGEAARQSFDAVSRARFLITRHRALIGVAAAAACWALYVGLRTVPEAPLPVPGIASAEDRPLSEQVLVQQAKAEASKGRYDLAQQRLQQALAKRPGDVEARELLAKIDSTMKAFRDSKVMPQSLPRPTDSIVLDAVKQPKAANTVVAATTVQPSRTGSVVGSTRPAASDAAAMLSKDSSSSSSMPANDPKQVGGGYNPNKLKRIERVGFGTGPQVAATDANIPPKGDLILSPDGVPVPMLGSDNEVWLAAPEYPVSVYEPNDMPELRYSTLYLGDNWSAFMEHPFPPRIMLNDPRFLRVDPRTGVADPLAMPVVLPKLGTALRLGEPFGPGALGEGWQPLRIGELHPVDPLGGGFLQR